MVFGSSKTLTDNLSVGFFCKQLYIRDNTDTQKQLKRFRIDFVLRLNSYTYSRWAGAAPKNRRRQHPMALSPPLRPSRTARLYLNPPIDQLVVVVVVGMHLLLPPLRLRHGPVGTSIMARGCRGTCRASR